MTVFIIIVFVATVIAIELIHRRSTNKIPERETEPLHIEEVAGVGICKNLAFHQHHTWARRIDAQTAAVGIDDFGKRIVGKIDHVILPVPGARLNSGQTCIKIMSDGREVGLISPVSGEVVDINPLLGIDPDALRRDPYGDGWLFKIKDWRLVDQIAALISGDRVVSWMRSCVERIVRVEPPLAGAVLQDGGLLCEDISDRMDKHDWIQIVREHLGTDPRFIT